MSLVFLAPSNSPFIFSLKLSIFKAYVIRLLLCKVFSGSCCHDFSAMVFRIHHVWSCQLSVSLLRVSAKPFCNLHLRSSVSFENLNVQESALSTTNFSPKPSFTAPIFFPPKEDQMFLPLCLHISIPPLRHSIYYRVVILMSANLGLACFYLIYTFTLRVPQRQGLVFLCIPTLHIHVLQ